MNFVQTSLTSCGQRCYTYCTTNNKTVPMVRSADPAHALPEHQAGLCHPGAGPRQPCHRVRYRGPRRPELGASQRMRRSGVAQGGLPGSARGKPAAHPGRRRHAARRGRLRSAAAGVVCSSLSPRAALTRSRVSATSTAGQPGELPGREELRADVHSDVQVRGYRKNGMVIK